MSGLALVKELIGRGLELLYDGKVSSIQMVPIAQLSREEYQELLEFIQNMLEFSWDPKDGVYETISNGDCIKLKVSVDGYGNVFLIEISKWQLEFCSKGLLAKLLREHLFIKEIERVVA